MADSLRLTKGLSSPIVRNNAWSRGLGFDSLHCFKLLHLLQRSRPKYQLEHVKLRGDRHLLGQVNVLLLGQVREHGLGWGVHGPGERLHGGG